MKLLMSDISPLVSVNNPYEKDVEGPDADKMIARLRRNAASSKRKVGAERFAGEAIVRLQSPSPSPNASYVKTLEQNMPEIMQVLVGTVRIDAVG